MSFLILNIIVVAYILYMFGLKKEYKKLSFIYSFSILTIFYTPSFYFYFGGESYRFFGEESLLQFYQISSLTIGGYLLLNIFFDSFRVRQNELIVSSNGFVKVYFGFFLLIVVGYHTVFFRKFPLVELLFASGELIERPDLTGAIPHFYTMSTIAYIIIPSIYFFYFKPLNKHQHIFLNILLVFLFVLAGNKGFVVYYFIFLWLYVFHTKLNIGLFVMLFFSFAIYAITKGITSVDNEVLEYLLSSPFRRFFVTQGTGFIHRIDMLNEGFDFVNNANPRGLKFDVFEHMYGSGIVGSAPTFYTGDFWVKYGGIFSYLTFVAISSALLFISRYLYYLKTNVKLFVYWNLYYILFILSMAELTTVSFLRVLVGIVNVFVVIFLSRLVVKK